MRKAPRVGLPKVFEDVGKQFLKDLAGAMRMKQKKKIRKSK